MHSSVRKQKVGGFDLKTHIRDKKGHVASVNPYRLVVENKEYKFERPPQSGHWYDADGKPIAPPSGFKSHEQIKKEKGNKVEKQEESVDLQAVLARLEALEKENAELKAQAESEEAESPLDESAGDAPDLSEELELIKEAGVEPAKVAPGFLKGLLK
jgi:hypothetical protein